MEIKNIGYLYAGGLNKPFYCEVEKKKISKVRTDLVKPVSKIEIVTKYESKFGKNLDFFA